MAGKPFVMSCCQTWHRHFWRGMLAFALSFDEIIVTTFTAGHERTLPLWLLNQLGRPRDVPVTNVVALLVMLVTTLPILGAWWLTREGDTLAGNGK